MEQSNVIEFRPEFRPRGLGLSTILGENRPPSDFHAPVGYRSVEVIYESRFTLVQRARRLSDDALVVLKSPKAVHAASAITERYRKEFRHLRLFDSQQIIRPLELLLDGPLPVLVLEDFDGSRSLRDILQASTMSVEELLALSIRMTEALGVVHSRRIVHRDINPNNVLVHSSTAEIKIIDFGCSSASSSEEQSLQSPLSLAGTLPYLSPEQTGRANRSIDYRSDFYSLGVTFYEMATGRLPFDSIDALDLVYAHLARRPTPPSELRTELPELLSQVIVKLLAKAAEDRYQSVSGLRHDLKEIYSQYQSRTPPVPFALGQYDRRRQFTIAEKLYGREAEADVLLRALGQASHGHPRLLLVDGVSGTGKTSIIRETYKPITRHRGYFIRGKFDQFKRDVPFSAVGQAFQELVRQWLTEPEDALYALKARLQIAVGPNASVLAEIIPELRWLLEIVDEAPDLGPIETQNRFNNVFLSLIQACAQRTHPLVLFLDDLQWADTATLNLLRVLMTSANENTALLVVGAYRTQEVDAAHPLMELRHNLKKSGASIDQITVPLLSPEHISELVSDTLSCTPPECGELSRLLWERTRGNPFFLHQYLTSIYQMAALTFDEVYGRWTWDLEKIGRIRATGDVVDLLLERLRRLSEPAQLVLGIAACMGSQFRLGSIAIALEKTVAATEHDLEETILEGIILAAGGSSSVVTETTVADDDRVFRFAHDRIQQAAYSLVDDDRRKVTHLQIARRMLRTLSRDGLDDYLFDVADHFAAAIDLVQDSGERALVASLFYRTGTKAKRSTAYQPAVRALKMALALLPKSAWTSDYELTMGIYRELNECAYLIGDNEYSDEISTIALNNAKSDIDKAPIYVIQINRAAASRDFGKAVRIGIKSLNQFGINLYERPKQIVVLFGVVRMEYLMRRVSWPKLASGPAMNDPKALASISILIALFMPSGLSERMLLFASCVLRLLSFSIRYGQAPATHGSLMSYAVVLTTLGFYRRARLYADLSLKLSQRYPHAHTNCAMLFGYAIHINHWLSPARDGIAYADKSYQLGLESGNHQYASYSRFGAVLIYEFVGTHLKDLAIENNKAKAFFVRSPDAAFEAASASIELMVDLLTTVDPVVAASLDEKLSRWVLRGEDIGIAPVAQKAMLMHVLFGSKEGAHYLAFTADRTLGRFFRTGVGRTTHYVYHTMMMTDLLEANVQGPRRLYKRLLKRNERLMKRWSKNCEVNFANYLKLVQAERARIRGDLDAALLLYDASIELSERGGFVQWAAIASERAARMCLSRQRLKLARPYVADARIAYEKWGARRKVMAIDAEFPDANPMAASTQLMTSTQAVDGVLTTTMPVTHVDIATMIKSSQALAGERVLDQLLARLMTMVLENAGAQRGSLLLMKRGELSLTAMFDGDGVTTGLSRLLSTASDVATSIVHYVTRTQQPIVLDDASENEQFGEDAYILARRPLSVLCLAMTHQGRVTGVLYLENNEMRGAFPNSRVAFLELLASQAAIAVENAVLYNEITAANTSLEAQVEERTKALEVTLSDLWAEMDLAKKIQTVLLPSDGTHGGYSITAQMKPAAQVGGDYYDIVLGSDHNWALIGDVSGHGVSAGLIMMMVQTSVRTLLLNQPGLSPSDLLSQVNRSVLSNLRKIDHNDYMTLQAFRLDGSRITYAGLHQEVIVYRSETRTVDVREDLNGMWIGISDDIADALVDNTLDMAPGDILLLYTDGITEARRHGTMVETFGLAKWFESAVHEGNLDGALIERLLQNIEDHIVNDDVSLMTVRRVG